MSDDESREKITASITGSDNTKLKYINTINYYLGKRQKIKSNSIK